MSMPSCANCATITNCSSRLERADQKKYQKLSLSLINLIATVSERDTELSTRADPVEVKTECALYMLKILADGFHQDGHPRDCPDTDWICQQPSERINSVRVVGKSCYSTAC